MAVAKRGLVAGTHWKNCSPRKSLDGWKEHLGKIKDTGNWTPEPESRGREWGGAEPLETLFFLTAAAAHRHHLGQPEAGTDLAD